MKTGLEYLDLLSKADQVRFLKNMSKLRVDKSIADYLMNEFEDFYDFISRSFDWSETTEGHDYWRGITNSHIV